jgi:putative transcriptional regulator
VSADSLKGRLLVAEPTMDDPNFARTVVLLLEHSDEGTLGVVLNRPSETTVGEALPGWAPVAATPAVVFVGGPVAPTGALALGTVSDGDAMGWNTVLGPIGLLDLNQSPEHAAPEVTQARLFAGHAGWGPGQLEGELATGGWFVVDAEPGDALAADPEQLWSAVLARQRGRLAWFANCPPDPRVN